ncbi:MAG: transposase [Phycisphaerae bacterium]
MDAKRSQFKTWGRNRSVRLRGFDYREHAPYHVVIAARSGTTPFTDARVAEKTCELIICGAGEAGAYLGAYCLMPDHLHLLISPDRSAMTLGELVGRLKGLTTNESWKLRWTGTLWQKRFYDHIVRKSEGIAEVARYIYENPDRKGLTADYPYRFVDGDLV